MIPLFSQVTDIHSVLEVTVYDEDRDKRCEFLGKVDIPLLKVLVFILKELTEAQKSLLFNISYKYGILLIEILFLNLFEDQLNNFIFANDFCLYVNYLNSVNNFKYIYWYFLKTSLQLLSKAYNIEEL